MLTDLVTIETGELQAIASKATDFGRPN